MGEELDYVPVLAEVGVQFHLLDEVLGLEAAVLVGVVFVDEFYGDDGGGLFEGGGFADALCSRQWLCLDRCFLRVSACLAYAPLPIVFEMMRKGRSSGRGAICDC